MPLPRLVTLGPRAAVSAANRLGRGAVANARSAAAGLSAQVEERRELDPNRADGGSPGSLVRMSREETHALLASRCVGRLAYLRREDVPDIVPVNYVLHDGDILVRSGVGPKLQAAERGETVAFEVDDIDENGHRGWSIVSTGPAQRLSTQQQRALPTDALPATWATGPRYAVIRIRPTRVEGRRLT